MATLRKYLSRDGAYKFSDFIKSQAKEACAGIEDEEIILTFVRRVCIFERSFPPLEDYDCKGKNVMVRYEKLDEKYCQRIFGSA